MTRGPVTFLSDYGLEDEFVGIVHRVIAQLAPGVTVIDLTHQVPAHDVRAGALTLWRAAPWLAPGVILGVVDPGVGTSRRAVVIEVAGAGAVLVGPDNGLLLPAATSLGRLTAAVIAAPSPAGRGHLRRPGCVRPGRGRPGSGSRYRQPRTAHRPRQPARHAGAGAADRPGRLSAGRGPVGGPLRQRPAQRPPGRRRPSRPAGRAAGRVAGLAGLPGGGLRRARRPTKWGWSRTPTGCWR